MRRRRPLLVVLGLVVMAIACGRLIGCGDASNEDPDGAAEPSRPVPQAPVASEPAAGVVEGDLDGLGAGIDPAEVPEVLGAAEGFARAWSRPDARQEAVAGLVTPELAAALTGPIPQAPSGSAYLLLDAPQWARVAVPARGGTIVLDLVRVEKRWLVSALAWWGEGT